ncbi:hypothetical protein BC830DRAFT_911191 [Chytriomyces sp. MP71]|nr:hypothetical protein BC830DRAFT_911191 [Chytriomyces sp. MP71]
MITINVEPSTRLSSLKDLYISYRVGAGSDVTVQFASGVYPVTNSLPIPTAFASLTLQGPSDNSAKLIGTTVIDSSCFTTVGHSDPNFQLLRNPASVAVCKLETQWPEWKQGYVDSCARGNCAKDVAGCWETQLFNGGAKLRPARFPNSGDTKYKISSMGAGYLSTKRGSSSTQFGAAKGVTNAQWASWNREPRLYVAGSLTSATWQWEKLGVSANAKAQRFSIQNPLCGSISANNGFYVTNALSELDKPDEYYIDPSQGMLYMLKSAINAGSTIELSSMTSSFISTVLNESLIISNLSFMKSNAQYMFSINGSGRITVKNSEFSQSPGGAFSITSPSSIVNNRFDRLGATVIYLGVSTANILIQGNQFTNFGWYNWVYQPAVAAHGTGHTVSHNTFSQSPHIAITLGGTQHNISNNEFTSLVQNVNDAGAIYAFDASLEQVFSGHVIEDNYFHDFGGSSKYAIYADDLMSGWNVQKNLFARLGGPAVFFHGSVSGHVSVNWFYHVPVGFVWSPSYKGGVSQAAQCTGQVKFSGNVEVRGPGENAMVGVKTKGCNIDGSLNTLTSSMDSQSSNTDADFFNNLGFAIYI